MVAAYNEQQTRVNGLRAGEDVWGGPMAARFRDDPRREPDHNLAAIAAMLRPDDVLVDAGGGAGRLSLPLALRCREVINVDPSPGMGEAFEAVRKEAGIENARFVCQEWTRGEPIEGDVALCSHVTYFVPTIGPFLDKLIGCARRRVILNVLSVPPPNSGPDLFALVRGEIQALVPGYQQLVPVLWERGIVPEIRVLPPVRTGSGGRTTGVFATRDEAVASIVPNPLFQADPELLSGLASSHFDELFVECEGGWVRRPSVDTRPMIITWETA